MSDKPCTFLVRFEKRYPIEVGGIKADLKHGSAAAKASALKQAIALIINGDTSHFRDLSTIIVRDVLPCCCSDEDLGLKLQRLVLLYLEAVYKGDDVYGRVPPDTSLVRDHLRRNLQHRDEYVRGLTLRFISRLAVAAHHHPDDDPLDDPLVVESVLVNLYHRHRFVRRHAYSAIFAIYYYLQPNVRRQLLPDDDDDALDRVEHQLNFERDAAATRNAFFMLCTCVPERAVAYQLANADRVVAEWPDEPAAVCAAANAYLKLLFSLIDTDVKRIVMERLLELGSKHNSFVKTIGSPSPSPNPSMMNAIDKKVLSVELDTTQMHIMHIDSARTIGRFEGGDERQEPANCGEGGVCRGDTADA